jgi:hypothetical protein
MTFSKWIDTFLSEKGIEQDQPFTVEGPSGSNFMAVEHVVSAMKSAPMHEQRAIKDMFVRIDFANACPMGYIKHLAQAIAA